MPPAAQIVLDIAATLITLGGLYDLITPRLPPNLIQLCGPNPHTQGLVRELLRALGGSLIAIGITFALFANGFLGTPSHRHLILILTLVLPAEGVNTICMARVRPAFYLPLFSLPLTIAGCLLAWLATAS